jgi:hypothetical protein
MFHSLQAIHLLAILQLAAAKPSPFQPSSPALSRATSSVQAASDHCGVQDYVILTGTPWIVYNMLYNADEMVGTQCTNYETVETAANGNPEVVWSSVTDIEYVEST